MMRRRDEGGVRLVRIRRHAEIERGVAAGEAEGERVCRLSCEAGDDRVLTIVVVVRESVVLPMLERGVNVRRAERLRDRRESVEEAVTACGDVDNGAVFAAGGDDVHDAADRVRAVQRRERTARDFDALYAGRRELSEVVA